MRACVIFNPTARGNKARALRGQLDRIAAACTLKPTTGPGAATTLAAEAVKEEFDTVIAAGGDGTVNEVVNGLAQAETGLGRTRLGILPLGTINVFARELGLPARLDRAWDIIRRGRELRVDLPMVEYASGGCTLRRAFAQLGGAGLDSRAIACVDWQWKTRIGPLAYVLGGLKAMRGRQPQVTVTLADGRRASGELVLLGNGRYYGGWIPMFPGTSLCDGRVAVRVFPRVTLLTLARFGLAWLFRTGFTTRHEIRWHTTGLTLTSDPPGVPFELDGDNIGPLPARVTVRREALRVLVP